MRLFMIGGVLAAAALSTTPALAAGGWDCQGPAYVCGGPASGQKAMKSAGYAKKSPKTSYAPTSYSAGGTSGKASYYWQGTKTASGARFNPNGLTAAHRTLPFGTRVMVTNQVNGKSVVVTINDRGPFIKGRIIDLSRGAAQAISMTGMGVAPVSISVLGRG